jgi:AAA+ ATPase superfamily predicted ATPase
MLQVFLKQNRESILQKWTDQTIGTYGPEMVRFLKKEKNQFSNPVRNTIVTSLENIYNCILDEKVVDDYQGLHEIIKLRAVQDFSPSKALAFLFDLKKIIRKDLIENNKQDLIISVDDKFDTLLGQAFDIYNDCRMKINEIKISEIKSQSRRAFEILEGRNK